MDVIGNSMVIVFCYRGGLDRDTLRADAISRYNALCKSSVDVSLYYDNGVPYLTGGKHISITHTCVDNAERIELVAIGDEPLGIDIESRARHVNMSIADRYFSENERQYIGGDRERLIEVWQKREAVGKSLKIGMYRDDVTCLDGFRQYDIYRGYSVILYSREHDVVFVAM